MDILYLDLYVNVALLFSLGSIYILIPFKRNHNPVPVKIIAGISIGIIGLILMSAQFNVTEGFLLDTRSVLLSLTAAFLGWIPALITAVITSALRIYQGGAGAFTGVLVIFATAGVGLLFRKYRLDKLKVRSFRTIAELYLFGVATHLVMILCFYTLNFDVANFVLGIIFWPVMIIFPIVTVPVGLILLVQSKNIQNSQIIEHISYHDYLTSLYNRHYLEIATLELDTEENYPLGVIVGDVNGLKFVNDSLGHLAGDQLLIEIARILMEVSNEKNVVARWGGDEFVILLPNSDAVETNRNVIKILELCDAYSTSEMNPSISLGFAVKEDASTSIDDIFSEAEELMYRNKLSAGNSIRSSLISTLENTLIERNYESEHHSAKMIKYGVALGKCLNLPQSALDEIALIARLHDIGKIGISEQILLKKGELTKDEYNEVKKHSSIGYRILEATPELKHVSKGVLYHHERWDGLGYPTGISGEEIPLVSRIVSIVDAFEVMTHGRVYQPKKDINLALAELNRCAGSQFDPKLVKCFVNYIEQNN